MSSDSVELHIPAPPQSTSYPVTLLSDKGGMVRKLYKLPNTYKLGPRPSEPQSNVKKPPVHRGVLLCSCI
jgi:hypothetical protein